jgi:hypothetical protein
MATTLTVNVPPDQSDAVAAWEDGQEYQITVRQTAPGALDLVSVESEDAAETGDEKGVEEGGMGGMMGKPTKNPAVAIVMGKMAGK